MTRPSDRIRSVQDLQWRSVIRIFAVVGALVGMALIANEAFENITCNGQAWCAKIHLSTFFVGLTLFGLCLLILQKGDVSLSIREARDTAVVVREIFARRGRNNDAPGTVVTTEVAKPAPVPRAPEKGDDP